VAGQSAAALEKRRMIRICLSGPPKRRKQMRTLCAILLKIFDKKLQKNIDNNLWILYNSCYGGIL
jgi:hypothetical protein